MFFYDQSGNEFAETTQAEVTQAEVTQAEVTQAEVGTSIQTKESDSDSDVDLQRPTGSSIAVMPFVNMSADKEQEYFSDGISEEILNVLSQIQNLHVTSRSSSFAFKGRNTNLKEVANLLGVSNILEGSVRKSGDRIRITAQLIAADSDNHLWSKTFDRTLTVDNIFDIQDEIAAAIVNSLKTELGLDVNVASRRQTSNMEAYDALLLASYHFSRLQFREGQLSMLRAIRLDPEYEDAYAFLAVSHTNRIWFGLSSWEEELPTIQGYVDKTLSLNPSHKGALSVSAIIRFYYYHDFQDALDIIARAEDSMGMWYPVMLVTLGQLEAAVKIREHQAKLNPLSPDAHRLHAMFLNWVGRSDDALRAWEKAGRLGLLDPIFSARLALGRGDREALEDQLEPIRLKIGDKAFAYMIYTAYFHFLSGDYEAAKGIFTPVHDSPNDYNFMTNAWSAYFHRDLESYIDYYARALEANEIQAWMGVSTVPADILEHPEFEEMLKRFQVDKKSVGKLKLPKLPI
jgi:TolB-like protein